MSKRPQRLLLAAALAFAAPTLLVGCGCDEQPLTQTRTFVGEVVELEGDNAVFLTDGEDVAVYIAERGDVLDVGKSYSVTAYQFGDSSSYLAYLGYSKLPFFGSCHESLSTEDSIRHLDGSIIDTRIVTTSSVTQLVGWIALFLFGPLVILWALLTGVRRLVRGPDDGYVDL